MSDFLDEKLQEIQNRLAELRPLIDEFHRLEAAEKALTGLNGGSSATSGRSTTSRRTSTSRSTASGRRRGRPKGGGTRANQALDLVRSRPGITIPELAEAMDIKQNYLYRVMPSLAEQGLVHKSGRGWHVRDGAAQPAEEQSATQEESEE